MQAKPPTMSRESWRIETQSTALLLVDTQNSEISDEIKAQKNEYYNAITQRALPNQQRLLNMARKCGCEVIYTVVESLTLDGRDRSLDHKLSNMFFPKGSPLSRVIEEVAPQGDEIVLPKTSSGVFNSTSIDYVLRNMGIKTLIVCGFVTDQCVDMAVRDAADHGYFVICAADACAAYTEERHRTALNAFSGYCRVLDTTDCIALLDGK